MKRTSLYKLIKELNNNIRLKYILTTIYIFILPVLLFLLINYRARQAKSMGLDFSLADSFCQITMFDYFLAVIITLSALYYNICIKDNMNPVKIIRYDNRGAIWFNQVYKLSISSLYITLYIILCTYVIGSFYSNKAINFHQENSLFFYNVRTIPGQMPLNDGQISIAMVVLFAFISVYLSILIASLIITIIRWVTGNWVLGWIVVISVVVIDIVEELNILLRNLSNDYLNWLNINNMILRLLNPVVWFVAITVIGFIVALRKDFLHENIL